MSRGHRCRIRHSRRFCGVNPEALGGRRQDRAASRHRELVAAGGMERWGLRALDVSDVARTSATRGRDTVGWLTGCLPSDRHFRGSRFWRRDDGWRGFGAGGPWQSSPRVARQPVPAAEPVSDTPCGRVCASSKGSRPRSGVSGSRSRATPQERASNQPAPNPRRDRVPLGTGPTWLRVHVVNHSRNRYGEWVRRRGTVGSQFTVGGLPNLGLDGDLPQRHDTDQVLGFRICDCRLRPVSGRRFLAGRVPVRGRPAAWWSRRSVPRTRASG